MIKIEKIDDGYLIENKVFFSQDMYKEGLINLAKNKGDLMSYGKGEIFVINYPGEYDKEDIYIKVYESYSGLLNHMFKIGTKKIFIIQDPKVLEKQDNENIDYWIYKNEETGKMLDKLELEGERIIIE